MLDFNVAEHDLGLRMVIVIKVSRIMQLTGSFSRGIFAFWEGKNYCC